MRYVVCHAINVNYNLFAIKRLVFVNVILTNFTRKKKC
jgi:hypothetical protein